MSTSDIVLMITGAQKYVCIVSRCPSLSPLATCKMGVKYILCAFFSGKTGCDSMQRFALPMCLPLFGAAFSYLPMFYPSLFIDPLLCTLNKVPTDYDDVVWLVDCCTVILVECCTISI